MEKGDWAGAGKRLGLIHIYCGDGKGKTTAAAGLALRYAGSGGRVLFVQFLKDGSSSEIPLLGGLPGIRVLVCPRSFGFTFAMDEAERRKAGEAYRELLAQACQEAVRMGDGLLVLDEALAASEAGLLEEEELAAFLEQKPAGLEVVLTGRRAGERLLALASYVTRMECVRHPYQEGVKARAGIEY